MVGLAGCGGGGGTPTEGGGGGDGDGDGGGATPTETPSGDGGTDGDGGTTDGGANGGPTTLTLGHLSPFSGGLGWIGSNSQNGVATAATEIQQQSDGVLGRSKINFNRQDTQTNPQSALSGFETLAAADVPAIVGPSSSVMPNLVQPIQSEQVPLITVMAGTIQLNDVGGEWMYRNVPSDAVGGRASGRYAYEGAGARRMALTFKNDKGSKSFSLSVGKIFSDLGGEIVARVPLAKRANSYRSEINKIVDSNPDIAQMTAGSEVSSLFIKNHTELGAEFNMLLGNDVLTESFIEKMGVDVMEGMIGQAPAPGPEYDSFSDLHQQVNDTEPGAFSAESYDAVNQFALAFQAHGEVERDAIPERLLYVSNPPGKKVSSFAEGKKELENGNNINYVGAGNPQNFDDKGNVLGPFSVLQSQDGEWTPIKTYPAEELAPPGGHGLVKA